MKVTIIGVGNMGGAIAQKLIKSSLVQRLYLSDGAAEKITPLLRSKKSRRDSGLDYLKACQFLILAVKPQDMAGLARFLRGKLHRSLVVVSIAAGITTEKLSKLLGHRQVVRVMPNIGLTAGQGIAAWKAVGLSVPEKQATLKLLASICENFEVNQENLIDAVTAVSGSGPAYFFSFAQALSEAAEKLGLPKAKAKLLVEKTFSAAASMQKQTSYPDLIARVASKKGTTEAALKVFKKKKLSEIVKLAALAAYTRSKEMNYGK